ncbi:MAG: DNA-directed RNA polymerase subunit alpha [Candidatus Zambryskibacteria bacterium CG_4_9_14_3_um_filter_40_16]|uniref:DNA-directed RNA polymerase subunit alpha n=2 Tax=Candidatus Zambryskiibacteriota TaxID=1817925 RepID=A0A2H0K6L8_9BACT|nr:MAG: DNA-directed RNA polymerase subunit alpha [Candidatus Zambryskibacteria bacterium CG11_big_fil_rev_8_21_14_0_20_40_24]PJA33511.1 MAG: DNA-directed RNA polymerase subunit alpha [Candidatus Zambryskibacteria bacterium CG_4_9_14_3_um_filter_40_16]
MSDFSIVLPSKPKIVKEDQFSGTYEIDGLYPGYGHTLGNSLRRIILSSLPGASITSVKIAGVNHEFSVIPGVKEDVITIILNLKRVRIKLLSQENQVITIKAKGPKEVKASDITGMSQVEILNPDLVIANLTDKNAELDIEMTIEKGMGYVSKEILQKNRVDVGLIAVDAIFTPIRRVSYEVENMRVGDRTDFNRLKIFIETDGTITPNEALETSVAIMINQLKAIVGFKEEENEPLDVKTEESETPELETDKKTADSEFLKTRIESAGLSVRTLNALSNANIRTVGGLARKKEVDLGEIAGLGGKGIQEIKDFLAKSGISLK